MSMIYGFVPSRSNALAAIWRFTLRCTIAQTGPIEMFLGRAGTHSHAGVVPNGLMVWDRAFDLPPPEKMMHWSGPVPDR
jgi:hypothetical protein